MAFRLTSATVVRIRLLVVLCLVAGPASAQQPPELKGAVNDFAGVIEPDEEARLDDLIRKLMAASGDVIVVATIETFQPAADIRVYATEMFENRGRGIGQKGRDNGMLVLLAVDDREVWSEVGYDLEGIITDGFAGETSRETMRPYFVQGDYGGGLLAGVTVFAQRIAQARNVSLEGVPVPRAAPPGSGTAPPAIVFIVLAWIVINLLRGALSGLTGGRRGRRRRRWGSMVGPFGVGYGGWHGGGRGGWSGGGGFGGGFGGFGGGRSGGGGGGASW